MAAERELHLDPQWLALLHYRPGLLGGYVSLVDGMVAKIRSEMGEEAYVIATGGIAELIAPESTTIQKVDRYLTLQGLRILYEMNRKEDA